MYRVWLEKGSADAHAARPPGSLPAGAGSPLSADSPAASSPSSGPVLGSEEDVVYQQVADTIAHEVGHAIGLRRNFRGSASIPWSQLTNTSFAETNGFITSIMAYLPLEPLPSASDGTPQRSFASPVLGAYDFAAIRFSYADWRSEEDAAAFGDLVADASLALGADEDGTFDALSQQYDYSATPLDWHRHLVVVVRRRLQELVNTAG